MNVQTFHLQELRELLVNDFGANEAAMAVAGISMGGYGALHYAAQPESPVAAAASFSAVADTEFGVLHELPILGLLSAPTVVHGSIQAVLLEQGASTSSGDELWGRSGSASWRAHNPRRLGARGSLATIPLYISAGQGSSAEQLDAMARERDGTLDLEEALAYLTVQSFLQALQRSAGALRSSSFRAVAMTG